MLHSVSLRAPCFCFFSTSLLAAKCIWATTHREAGAIRRAVQAVWTATTIAVAIATAVRAAAVRAATVTSAALLAVIAALITVVAYTVAVVAVAASAAVTVVRHFFLSEEVTAQELRSFSSKLRRRKWTK